MGSVRQWLSPRDRDRGSRIPTLHILQDCAEIFNGDFAAQLHFLYEHCGAVTREVAAPVYPPKPQGVEESNLWDRWCSSVQVDDFDPVIRNRVNFIPLSSGCDGRTVVAVKSGYLVRPWQRGCTKQSN
jgi:hypothetical protein